MSRALQFQQLWFNAVMERTLSGEFSLAVELRTACCSAFREMGFLMRFRSAHKRSMQKSNAYLGQYATYLQTSQI